MNRKKDEDAVSPLEAATKEILKAKVLLVNIDTVIEQKPVKTKVNTAQQHLNNALINISVSKEHINKIARDMVDLVRHGITDTLSF